MVLYPSAELYWERLPRARLPRVKSLSKITDGIIPQSRITKGQITQWLTTQDYVTLCKITHGKTYGLFKLLTKRQNHDLWKNIVGWDQCFTRNTNNLTRTMSVRPWQIPCLAMTMAQSHGKKRRNTHKLSVGLIKKNSILKNCVAHP